MVSYGGTEETVMCIGAFKDLEESSLLAIMELAFASEKMNHSTEDHKIVRSRSLPSISSSTEKNNNNSNSNNNNNTNTRQLYRSSSDDFTSSTSQLISTNSAVANDISARARSNMYSDILDAEEEALGLSPSGGHVSVY